MCHEAVFGEVGLQGEARASGSADALGGFEVAWGRTAASLVWERNWCGIGMVMCGGAGVWMGLGKRKRLATPSQPRWGFYSTWPPQKTFNPKP